MALRMQVFGKKDIKWRIQRQTIYLSYSRNIFVKKMAKQQGIGGVKIDSQSLLDVVCEVGEFERDMTRLKMTKLFREAFTCASDLRK